MNQIESRDSQPLFNRQELIEYPCPRCKSQDSQVKYAGEDYLHNRKGNFKASCCNKCGLWFQNPSIPHTNLASAYPENYLPHANTEFFLKEENLPFHRGMIQYLGHIKGYPNLTPNYSLTWRFFQPVWRCRTGVQLIPSYVKNGKLLDVGCGNGRHLHLMKRLGWEDLYGIELIPQAAEKARNLGFNIKCGQVENELSTYPNNSFDVIIAGMILEHLANPFDVLELMYLKLKPGGQLSFSTVTRDSLDAKIYGKYWGGFDFPRHIVYFSNTDIKKMLANKFVNVQIFHQTAPDDFTVPSEWKRQRGESNLFDRLILSLRYIVLYRILAFLSIFKLTCRVSILCRKI